MHCECKNCSEMVGRGEVMSGIGYIARFAVPLWTASLLWPLFERVNQRVPWDKIAHFVIIGSLLWAWLTFRFWFPRYYSWLWFTLFKPCPSCGKRRWTEGHFSGFGL